MNDAERIRLHFIYCALILVMSIIAIATDRWTAQKDFTAYLSNAATMTSLLLGLVAIFYSFISNDGLSKSLGSIETVSSEVRDARKEIGYYVDLTKEVTSANSENTLLLKQASEGVKESLSSLDITLNAISKQNLELNSMMQGLPTRFEQMETKLQNVAKAIEDKPIQDESTSTVEEIPVSRINIFLKRPSLSYNLVTYAVVLCFCNKKLLDINKLTEAISLNAPNTINGFVLAMHSIRLLSREVVSQNNKVYKITFVNSDLVNLTKKYIDEYLNTYFADGQIEKGEWIQKINNVEALFLGEK